MKTKITLLLFFTPSLTWASCPIYPDIIATCRANVLAQVQIKTKVDKEKYISNCIRQLKVREGKKD
jgi:hypothetical protein